MSLCEDGTAERIISSMSEIGLIADGYIVAWDKRQSTSASRTTESSPKASSAMSDAERQRKRRAKLKEETDHTGTVAEDEKEGKSRDSHDVTGCHGADKRR